jgi:hypothetical protein
MGIGYNILSFCVVTSGGRQLSTTNPVTGGVSLALYGLSLLTAYYGFIRVYRALMALSIVAFGYGGIVIHFMNYLRDPSQYASTAAWVIAVGINIFGLFFNLAAALGRFENGGMKQ